MDWIFDNLYVVLIIVGALVSWLKNRAETKTETSDEERAREELIRGLEEAERNLRPSPRTPPPLMQETKRVPPPILHQQLVPEVADPYATEDNPMHRQDDMQHRLDEARRQQEEARILAKQARDKRLRATRLADQQTSHTPAGPLKLRDALKDPRQSRRAIVLREILGPPVALKR